MIYFHRSVLIHAPVAVVWAFHERPDVLQLLTPPWQPVQVVRREGGLGVGAETEFRLFVGPLPLRWLARHIACEPERLFVDEQVEGPFDSWQHRHEFTPEGQHTRLTDAIACSLPAGWVLDNVLGWAIEAQLAQLFRYRHEVTQRQCETTQRQG